MEGGGASPPPALAPRKFKQLSTFPPTARSPLKKKTSAPSLSSPLPSSPPVENMSSERGLAPGRSRDLESLPLLFFFSCLIIIIIVIFFFFKGILPAAACSQPPDRAVLPLTSSPVT